MYANLAKKICLIGLFSLPLPTLASQDDTIEECPIITLSTPDTLSYTFECIANPRDAASLSTTCKFFHGTYAQYLEDLPQKLSCFFNKEDMKKNANLQLILNNFITAFKGKKDTSSGHLFYLNSLHQFLENHAGFFINTGCEQNQTLNDRLSYTCGFILGSSIIDRRDFFIETDNPVYRPKGALISLLSDLLSISTQAPIISLSHCYYSPIQHLDKTQAACLGEGLTKSRTQTFCINNIDLSVAPSLLKSASQSTSLKEIRMTLYLHGQYTYEELFQQFIKELPQGLPFNVFLFINCTHGEIAPFTTPLGQHFGDKLTIEANF